MSQPTRILLALVTGLVLGLLSARTGGAWVGTAITVAEPIGGLWLNALQMTIIPLVVSLLITGIAASMEAAAASLAEDSKCTPSSVRMSWASANTSIRCVMGAPWYPPT